MNSYKTLAAAAHISGIPVRYAVAFGQAYHAGHYRPAESFGEMVRRDQIASYRAFPMRASKTERVNALPSAWPGLVDTLRLSGLQVWDIETDGFPQVHDSVYVNGPRVKDDPVGRWNAEDKERQLKLKQYNQRDVEATQALHAAIPRRDYGVKAEQEKFAVVQGTHRGEDVYWVSRLSDLKRVTFFTTVYENATWWAEIRNNGDIKFTPPSEATEVMRQAVR